jgi:nicotinate-nucleotide adenylyltransferase
VKVGLYGGTFDPIHDGHLHVIKTLISQNLVDTLLVLPAGNPRLRDSAPQATGAQRRQMCQLAVSSLPDDIKKRVEVNPIEILLEGHSYTIDTVEAVAQTYPGAQIVLIVGTDAYEKIDQWHRAEELKQMVEFLVIDRPDFPGQACVERTQIAARAAAEKFGSELVALDLSDQTVLSEVFLIITATNAKMIDSIADNVEEQLRLVGDKPLRREGTDEWVLLDYSDLVVHIQSSELRRYYMLDRLWNDCPKIELDIVKEEAAARG